MAIEQINIKRRKSTEDDEMDITPMIDITFLLLIFFLVASKMDQAGDVTLPPATHGVTVSVDNSVVLTVQAGSDGTGLVYKGDSSDVGNLIPGDEETRAEAIAAYVDEIMLGEAKEYVLIKAAKDVQHKVVSGVAKAIGKSSAAESLHVAVLEEN